VGSRLELPGLTIFGSEGACNRAWKIKERQSGVGSRAIVAKLHCKSIKRERERERERDKLVEAGERDGQSRAPLPRRECLAHSRKRQSGRDTV